jgi:hypothetical protein
MGLSIFFAIAGSSKIRDNSAGNLALTPPQSPM